MENTNSNLVGLTDSEVQKRIDEGKVNISTNIKTKSIKRIFCDNIFTLFNLINVILLAALIFVGSHKNMHCMRRQLKSQRKFAYRRIKSH